MIKPKNMSKNFSCKKYIITHFLNMENRFFRNAKNPEALHFKAFGIQYCIIARYDRELQPRPPTPFKAVNCIIARYDRELQLLACMVLVDIIVS